MDYALITGATKGIGYELMLLFARHGYQLVLVSRQKDQLIRISKEIGQKFGVKVLVRFIPRQLVTKLIRSMVTY